jgi:hypothetical protein
MLRLVSQLSLPRLLQMELNLHQLILLLFFISRIVTTHHQYGGIIMIPVFQQIQRGYDEKYIGFFFNCFVCMYMFSKMQSKQYVAVLAIRMKKRMH